MSTSCLLRRSVIVCRCIELVDITDKLCGTGAMYISDSRLSMVSMHRNASNNFTPISIWGGMYDRPAERNVRAMLQVCCAVQALHQQQPPLAHRDVKPHNVLIRRTQPESEAASPSASSAASSSRRADSQLKSNGESEPLASSHAGHARSYHAVLMVGADLSLVSALYVSLASLDYKRVQALQTPFSPTTRASLRSFPPQKRPFTLAGLASFVAAYMSSNISASQGWVSGCALFLRATWRGILITRRPAKIEAQQRRQMLEVQPEAGAQLCVLTPRQTSPVNRCRPSDEGKPGHDRGSTRLARIEMQRSRQAGEGQPSCARLHGQAGLIDWCRPSDDSKPAQGFGRARPVRREAREAQPSCVRLHGQADLMMQRRPSDEKECLQDFGSTRPARIEVQERRQALEAQEEAEAHSSAPYRAPELFDVPSRCSLDERTDVWSLGCLLYFLMYGCSPFEKVCVTL